MARTFVVGDIHGAYRALRQCLERSAFDYQNDYLISLGDVSDGWPETRACIDELLALRNLTFILGNHDWWTLQWMKTGAIEEVWFDQGGEATIRSYAEGVPSDHIDFLEKASLYFLKNNRLFVHAGILPDLPIEQQPAETLLWDRDFARIALDFYQRDISGKLTGYDEVYVGHTPIPFPHPIQSSEVWLMDTGAGWSGTLSMMNIETKEIFSSDAVPSLYPGVPGRKKKVT
jgi:serine/threonine protein phosphatase 1